MKTVWVIPKKDLKVRCPDTKAHLAIEGEEKPCTAYWLRREAAGEVELHDKKPLTKQK